MKPHVPGRWHAQGLGEPRFGTGAEVVAHLGAVQSQLHDMALWAVGRRSGRTLAELQTEFDAGHFVRTHVLRPTWHLVLLDDLHWLQALTAVRVQRLDAPQRARFGIDDAFLAEARDAAVAALDDGPLTRAALGEALSAAGLDAAGPQMAHVAMHLETACVVVSGPMQGKQHTYRLAPPPTTPVPDRDDLLARVAHRYGHGHGAFRDRDLAWWTSLTLTDARRAIDLAGLPVTEVDGEPYAVPEGLVEADPPRATLLSNFDEYISYARDPRDLDVPAATLEEVLRSGGLLLVDGRLAGRWKRTVGASVVDVEVVSLAVLTGAVLRAVETEAAAFGRFVGREVRLTVT